MSLYQGFIQLGAGLSVGLAGLSAGIAIGIVGDAGVRGTAQQPRLFVGCVAHMLASGSEGGRSCLMGHRMVLILIFAEVLGLCEPFLPIISRRSSPLTRLSLSQTGTLHTSSPLLADLTWSRPPLKPHRRPESVLLRISPSRPR